MDTSIDEKIAKILKEIDEIYDGDNSDNGIEKIKNYLVLLEYRTETKRIIKWLIRCCCVCDCKIERDNENNEDSENSEDSENNEYNDNEGSGNKKCNNDDCNKKNQELEKLINNIMVVNHKKDYLAYSTHKKCYVTINNILDLKKEYEISGYETRNYKLSYKLPNEKEWTKMKFHPNDQGNTLIDVKSLNKLYLILGLKNTNRKTLHLVLETLFEEI